MPPTRLAAQSTSPGNPEVAAKLAKLSPEQIRDYCTAALAVHNAPDPDLGEAWHLHRIGELMQPDSWSPSLPRRTRANPTK